MTRPDGDNAVLRAVQEALSGYHRQIEEVDEELSRLVHRREEIVVGARTALLEQLPEDVRGGLAREIAAERPPSALGARAAGHLAQLPAVVSQEVEALHARLRGFHSEIEGIDADLARLVHRREELVTAAREAMARCVPDEAEEHAADRTPRVAMALACW
ncbi:hypothetical protein [Streptoalloteichus hindustanus]|uniref:Uncharacterized protein n=1 Tax=Streptoalloteichus hindustanus TaxID=2017 RepID=A0A1M4ZCJ1_STRHI|nr:hypothetical protein [Streptoalloteichus hindustanus]SHF15769.1 hypothetical protein SAMN05444320_102686 [Streptoalloteichus hindustanus]